jgi:hypothetical protein
MFLVAIGSSVAPPGADTGSSERHRASLDKSCEVALHDVMKVSIKAEFIYIFAEATPIIANLAVPFCYLP